MDLPIPKVCTFALQRNHATCTGHARRLARETTGWVARRCSKRVCMCLLSALRVSLLLSFAVVFCVIVCVTFLLCPVCFDYCWLWPEKKRFRPLK